MKRRFHLKTLRCCFDFWAQHRPLVFSKKKDSRVTDMEEKEEDLFKKIGEQQVELDFL